MAIYYVVYQQVENYVVVPRVMQRTVSVPGAVTVVAALAGGTLLGVLGALLAIPFAAGLLLLYEEVLLPASAATDSPVATRTRATHNRPPKVLQGTSRPAPGGAAPAEPPQPSPPPAGASPTGPSGTPRG